MKFGARNEDEIAIAGERSQKREGNFGVKTPLILLLTNDPQVEETVAQALNEIGGLSHRACCASEALETTCAIGDDLLLAVIDFEHGFDRLSLVQAIRMYCEHLPIIVITPDAGKYMEALASADGACFCLHKPVSTAQIEALIKSCLPKETNRTHRLTI